MRRVFRLVACASLAVTVAGCNALDSQFLREGVGTELYTAEVPEESRVQDLYLGHLCHQAGLSTIPSGEAIPFCDDSRVGPNGWSLVVQAGMNDIDRRCDAYLAWLDNKRRWREPILKQLHTTAAATAAIMGLTGVGASPIAIVGTAFGFAQESFVNFQSRLVLEVNQSTVQSLVLTRQLRFRGNVIKDPVTQRPVVITNRPAAVYVLRSYLRICMPFSIETEINTTLTGVDAGLENPLRTNQSLFTIPASGRSVMTDLIIEPRRPLPPPPPPPPPRVGTFTPVERSMSTSDITKIQTALCVRAESGLGPQGSRTRLAIRDYLVGRRFPGISERDESVLVTDQIRASLSDAIDEVSDCFKPEFGFKNSYEVGAYGVPARLRRAKIVDVQKKLKTFLTRTNSTVPAPNESGMFDDATRKAIGEFRKSIPGQGTSEQLDLTLDLLIKGL